MLASQTNIVSFPTNGNDGISVGQNIYILTVGNLASASGSADYTCDGTDDNVQFQAALNALPAIGGKLVVLAGNYSFSAAISRAIDNVIIEGVGKASFIARDGLNPVIDMGARANWIIKDLKTDAGSITLTSATKWLWENVWIDTTFYAVRTDTDITGTEYAAPVGRVANLAVAASDATAQEKAQADLVLTGSGDITAILARLPTTGGVTFSSGTINMEKSFVINGDGLNIISNSGAIFKMTNAANTTFVVATSGQKDIAVADASGFAIGDSIIISDANYSDSYDIANIAGNTITVNINIIRTLNNGQLWEFYPAIVVTADDVVVKGISIVGNRANRMAGRAGGVYPSTFTANTNATWGMESEGTILISNNVDVTNVTVDGVKFQNTPSHGILILANDGVHKADNLHIKNNAFLDIGDKAVVSVAAGDYWEIADNYINITGAADGCVNSGGGWGDGIQIHQDGVDAYKITGNYIENVARCGIDARYNSTNTELGIIANNTVINFGTRNFAGLDEVCAGVKAYYKTIISGNIIQGGTIKTEDVYGIYANGLTDGKVIGNTVLNVLSSTNASGIEVIDGDNVSIEGNQLGTASSSIEVRNNPTFLSIKNNTFSGTGSIAIIFWACTTSNIDISGNMFNIAAMTYAVQLRTCVITKLSVVNNQGSGSSGFIYYYDGSTAPGAIVEGNVGYIASGEIRTASGSLTAGNANAIGFAWHNLESRDIYINKVVISVTTVGGTAGSKLDVGIADNATGTNRGTEFFDDIDLNAAEVSDSTIGVPGQQTVWVFCQDTASATDGWIVGQILVENAASLVGKYYIEYTGI